MILPHLTNTRKSVSRLVSKRNNRASFLYFFMQSDHDDFHQLEPDAYHLWEYPGWALSKPIPLLEFDVSNPTQSKTSVVSIPIKRQENLESFFNYKNAFYRAGTCHAFVLWMDYFLDADTVLSTGLAEVRYHIINTLT